MLRGSNTKVHRHRVDGLEVLGTTKTQIGIAWTIITIGRSDEPSFRKEKNREQVPALPDHVFSIREPLRWKRIATKLDQNRLFGLGTCVHPVCDCHSERGVFRGSSPPTIQFLHCLKLENVARMRHALFSSPCHSCFRSTRCLSATDELIVVPCDECDYQCSRGSVEQISGKDKWSDPLRMATPCLLQAHSSDQEIHAEKLGRAHLSLRKAKSTPGQRSRSYRIPEFCPFCGQRHECFAHPDCLELDQSGNKFHRCRNTLCGEFFVLLRAYPKKLLDSRTSRVPKKFRN